MRKNVSKDPSFLVPLAISGLLIASLTTRAAALQGPQRNSTGQNVIGEADGEIPIRTPKPIFRVEPLYPEQAPQARIEGTVVIFAEVNSSGFPENLRVLRSLGHGLHQEALEAVQLWRFEPFRENGKSIRVATFIPLSFELTPAGQGPANTPSENSIFRVNEGIRPPMVRSRVAAIYTEAARNAKREGTVILYAEIKATGEIGNLQVLRTLGEGLDEAAVDAIKQWKFDPALKDGKPVPVFMTVEVTFSLR
jgi:TonB family protein